MKIVHIADSHLGHAMFSRLDPESGMNLRERQIYDNFLQGVDDIISLHADVLVHAGDLFDMVRPKTKAYTVALEALDRLDAAGIPVVLIAGNHSMVKTRYTTSPYEVLDYHRSRMTAAYRFRYEKVEIGDTIFHLIPNLLRAEDYRAACDGIVLSGTHHNVLVTHGLATAIRDKRLATVAEHELDATILSDRFDYIALGHYHHQCRITENAWYSGSAEFLNYGEIGDVKGGLDVDLGRHAVCHIDLPRTPMVDLGTIRCHGMHPTDITGEIQARIGKSCLPEYSMVQVTLDGLPRDYGQKIEVRDLSAAREHLLDLKIRIRADPGDTTVPFPQDIRTIDYLQEFGGFLAQQHLTEEQRKFVTARGREVLGAAMEKHREEGG